MPDTRSEETLMALLALKAEDFSAEPATAPLADAAPLAGLPTLEQRIEMFASAVCGPDGVITAEMRAAARDQILTAMAADLVDETTDAFGPQYPKSPAAQFTNAEPGTAMSEDLSQFWTGLGRGLQRLISSAAEALTIRRLGIAAVPLVALLIVGSVWTGNWLTGNEPELGNPHSTLPAGNRATADAPRMRSLEPSSQPVETAPEQKLEVAIAADEARLGPAHPAVARKLVDLASLYQADGRYDEAAALCARALAIQEQALGAKDPDTLSTLKALAAIYRAQGRTGDADQILTRATQP
jgi:tetratricopeptide (TPR) repeat protein